MMGHHARLQYDEEDKLTDEHHGIRWRPGRRKEVKQKHNRKLRKEFKEYLKEVKICQTIWL